MLTFILIKKLQREILESSYFKKLINFLMPHTTNNKDEFIPRDFQGSFVTALKSTFCPITFLLKVNAKKSKENFSKNKINSKKIHISRKIIEHQSIQQQIVFYFINF